MWQLRRLSKAAGRWLTVPWAIRRTGIAALVALCLVAWVDDPLASLLPRTPIPAVAGLRCDTTTYAAPSVPAATSTRYVDGTSGSDAADGLTAGTAWKTLEKIAANAVAGREFLCWGTFNNQQFFPAAGTNGTATDKIVMKKRPGFSWTVTDGPLGDFVFVFYGIDHWVLDGVSMDATVADDYGIIVGQGSTFIWIRNSTYRDFSDLNFNNAPDCRIEDCVIDDVGDAVSNSGDGLFVQNGSHRLVVARNTITNCGHMAITIGGYQSAGEATCDDCVVVGNLVNNVRAGGIAMNGKANRTIVECNDVWGTGTAEVSAGAGTKNGIVVEGTNNLVRYNRVWGGDSAAIHMQALIFASFTEACTGNEVYHNTLFSNRGAPLKMVVSSSLNANTVLANNLIQNNLGWKNNETADEPGDFFESVYWDIWIDLFGAGTVWTAGTIGGNHFKNNRFSRGAADPDGGWVLIVRTAGAGNNLKYTLAQFESTYPNVSSNVDSGDPLFVSEVTPDLHLQATSPVIDDGVIIAGVEYEGAAPDLGAFEGGTTLALRIGV